MREHRCAPRSTRRLLSRPILDTSLKYNPEINNLVNMENSTSKSVAYNIYSALYLGRFAMKLIIPKLKV